MKTMPHLPAPDMESISTAFGLAEATNISPCSLACPLGINVQRYVGQAQRGLLLEALETILERCPLPGICGYLCQRPCEAACRRGGFDRALAIRWIKKAAVGAALAAGMNGTRSRMSENPSSGLAVAIIGAGPAGLSAAWKLANAGHRVTLFDRREIPGGLLADHVPEFRLPARVLHADVERILARERVTFRGGVEIGAGRDVIADLEKANQWGHHFAAILIATGAPKWGSLRIGDGVTIGQEISGVTTPEEIVSQHRESGPDPNGRQSAVVLGASTTSLAVARLLKRAGWPKVVLVASHPLSRWPADKEDIVAARADGVEFRDEFFVDGLVIEEGRVLALTGRPAVVRGLSAPRPKEGDLQRLDTDLVVPQVTRAPDVNNFVDLPGFRLTADGAIAVDGETLELGGPAVFAAGECTTGPKTVVEAISAGIRAASTIQAFLTGEPQLRHRSERIRAWSELVAISPVQSKERDHLFHLVESIEISSSDAAAEARRCLRCGPCAECDRCSPDCCHERALIPLGTFDEDNADGYRVCRVPAGVAAEDAVLAAKVDPHLCTGCGRCEEACPHHAVVVRFQLEGRLQARVARPACRGCGRCNPVCPFGAIDLPAGVSDLATLWDCVEQEVRQS